jgi:hypothetical protein
MKRKWIPALVLLMIAIALISVVGVRALGGYSLGWWAVAGGGTTTSAGGSYSLGGTIGQPAAGTSAGGPYNLIGGFWAVTQQFYRLFLPLIIH